MGSVLEWNVGENDKLRKWVEELENETIKAAEEVEKLSNDLEAATKAKEQNPFNLTPGHLSDVEVQVATALLRQSPKEDGG